MEKKSKIFLILLFINFAGAWASWLVLGPFLTFVSQTIVYFGLFALIRQFFGFLGTLFAESLDLGRNVAKVNIFIELANISLNLIALLLILFFTKDFFSILMPFWGLLKYFVGGVSTVYLYKLILNKHSAANSVIIQLSLTQGSVIIGALLSFLFSNFEIRDSIKMALCFDTVTSALIMVYLKNLNTFDKPPEFNSVITRFKNVFKNIYIYTNKKLSIGFIFALFGISGLPSIFMYVSSFQKNLLNFYSALNILNGFFLLMSSIILLFFEKLIWFKRFFIFFGCFLFGLAVLFLLKVDFVNFTNPESLTLSFFLLCAGSTIFLLTSHQIVLGAALKSHASLVRSSLSLYLTVVFGASELLFSIAFTYGFFHQVLIFKFLALTVSCFLLGLKKC